MPHKLTLHLTFGLRKNKTKGNCIHYLRKTNKKRTKNCDLTHTQHSRANIQRAVRSSLLEHAVFGLLVLTYHRTFIIRFHLSFSIFLPFYSILFSVFLCASDVLKFVGMKFFRCMAVGSWCYVSSTSIPKIAWGTAASSAYLFERWTICWMQEKKNGTMGQINWNRRQ